MARRAALRGEVVSSSLPSRSLALRCPAKVNLHLEVLGRRPDGYHEVRTVLAAVGVWDEVTLELAPPGVVTLEVAGEAAVPAGEENLMVRAARLLAQVSGAAHGVHMSLAKRIPVAGGMGGGSSDAAATLAGLAVLWGLDGSYAALQPLAARLGADVPFFLVGGVALGTGRGSEVEPLPDLPPLWAVIWPGQKVSTAAVYASLGAGSVQAWGESPVRRWCEASGAFPFGACRNDLASAVRAAFPWVGERLALLAATKALLVEVAGSGATVFALYGERQVAEDVGRALAAEGVLVAPLLSRVASRQPLVIARR